MLCEFIVLGGIDTKDASACGFIFELALLEALDSVEVIPLSISVEVNCCVDGGFLFIGSFFFVVVVIVGDGEFVIDSGEFESFLHFAFLVCFSFTVVDCEEVEVEIFLVVFGLGGSTQFLEGVIEGLLVALLIA